MKTQLETDEYIEVAQQVDIFEEENQLDQQELKDRFKEWNINPE